MDKLLNQVIENYKFVSVLGKGGMGIVYKAYDMKLDRYVAVKILSSHIVDKPKYVERFKREAKHQAQLMHPNIVTVYGFIEHSGLLGIVMEYAEGDSLDKVIYHRKHLHVNDAVYVLKQALVGIGYAHVKGFVHRDIKPSNIIVNREGTVKIMDFGISKSLFEKGVTKTGSKIGTVLYMSPEQVRGEDVTHLTDIYSLGCTFYEMIIGEPPFYFESDYDVMDGHLKKTHIKVAKRIQGIPGAVDKVLDIALHKNAHNRYPNCESFLNDVIQLEKDLASLQSEIFQHKSQNPKKKKTFSIIGFITMISLFGLLVYFSYTQVDELIKNRELDVLKEYSIHTLFKDQPDEFKFRSIEQLKSPTKLSLNRIEMLNDNYGFLAGDAGQFFSTQDSGRTWRRIFFPELKDLNDSYFSIQGHGVIVGDSSSIYYSEDYFSSYSTVKLFNNTNLMGIEFINSSIGFVFGHKGFLARSVDGGKGWKQININFNETIYDAHFINDKTGFLVGWNGLILRTENQGKTWQKIELPTKKYLKSIDFWDEENGVIVGGGGNIFVTDNAGQNWRNASIKDAGGLQKVKYVSDKIIIAVGSRGKIIISENAGLSWKALENDFYIKFNDIAVTPGKSIYLVGENGTIIKLI